MHRIKHHALFSSVHHGFSTGVCIVYMHVYTYTYVCIYMHIQYPFNHCVVSVCIQVCTTNREGGAGGEKLPASLLANAARLRPSDSAVLQYAEY